MAAARQPIQERSDDNNRSVLTSRGRTNAVFPPNLNSFQIQPYREIRHQIRPPELSEDTNVSSDFASLNTGPIGHNTRQQATVVCESQNDGSRPSNNLPEQDSSPHIDRRQGNSSCHATSISSITSQHSYKGEQKYKYPEMKDYGTRLNTFETWPRSSPTKEALARANMFYEGVTTNNGEQTGDQVLCFKCGYAFKGWEDNDNPADEHMRIYSDCFSIKWLEEEM